MKKKSSPSKLTISVTQEIDLFTVLEKAIEKHGAKKVLFLMSVICNMEYIHFTDSLACILANKLQIENSIAGKIFFFMHHHWDDLAKKSANFMATKMDEVERKKQR
jgi:hypothetical protein